jgi:hypothetical protein
MKNCTGWQYSIYFYIIHEYTCRSRYKVVNSIYQGMLCVYNSCHCIFVDNISLEFVNSAVTFNVEYSRKGQ